MRWAKPSGSLAGWSVTEVQGSDGCSYISNYHSWYEGRRSSYLLFKYRQGACGVIVSTHNKWGSSLGWPLDVRQSLPHHKRQTAASVSPWIFTEKSPCATFPSNIRNYLKEVVRRCKIITGIFHIHLSLNEKKKINAILKQYEAAETKVKLFFFSWKETPACWNAFYFQRTVKSQVFLHILKKFSLTYKYNYLRVLIHFAKNWHCTRVNTC